MAQNQVSRDLEIFEAENKFSCMVVELQAIFLKMKKPRGFSARDSESLQEIEKALEMLRRKSYALTMDRGFPE